MILCNWEMTNDRAFQTLASKKNMGLNNNNNKQPPPPPTTTTPTHCPQNVSKFPFWEVKW
jgi:hypothetical protein